MADPLNMIPNIDINISNIMYCIALFISFCLIVWSLNSFRSSYDYQYFPIEALIEEVDCNKININNHQNEYHCVIGIKYKINNNYHENSLAFVDTEQFYKGDKIIVMVSKNNPLNIKTVVLTDQNIAVFIFIFALLLMIIATGIKFIKLS